MNQLTPHKEDSKGKKMTGAWATLILSILYALAPLDLIPDTIPFAGWIDDMLVVVMGVLHFFQRSAEQRNSGIASLLKIMKWILIALVVIAVLLMLLFGSFIISLFSK